ncbi:hypothetical protein BASA81_006822 [Batrachochytrium salamandrivorans]|nr:hypothetical protein BASA81_006822 [Batrachochytrium salamandrivorans]
MLTPAQQGTLLWGDGATLVRAREQRGRRKDPLLLVLLRQSAHPQSWVRHRETRHLRRVMHVNFSKTQTVNPYTNFRHNMFVKRFLFGGKKTRAIGPPPPIPQFEKPTSPDFSSRLLVRLGTVLGPQTESFDLYLPKLISCSEPEPEAKSLVALELLERYVKAPPRMARGGREEEWLLVVSTAFLLAAKLVDDYVSTRNVKWAMICGHAVDHLSDMELEFCLRIHWRLFVSQEQYQSQRDKLLLL